MKPSNSALIILLAGLHSIVDSIVSSLWHLRLEIQIDQFALLRRPLAISIPMEHDLVTSCITNFSRCMAQQTISRPFNPVAGLLRYEKRLGASLVAILIDALLNGVILDAAGLYH